MNLSDFITSAKESVLLIGPPGSGKTTLCTQLPGKTAILECDNNIKGPAAYCQLNKLSIANIIFDVPHVRPDPKTGIPSIVPRDKRFDNAIATLDKWLDDPTIDNIVVSSATTFSAYAQDKIRSLEKRKIKGIGGATNDEPMRIQDWGSFATFIKEIVITQKASGKRIVWCAHMERRGDESKEGKEADKTMYSYLAMPGQLRETFAGFFDEVWYITVEQKTTSAGVVVKRYIQTTPTDFRDQPLGLKTALGLGPRFELDFTKLNEKLAH